MICNICGFDSGGNRNVLARHMGEVHRANIPVGFSKPSLKKEVPKVKTEINSKAFESPLIALVEVDDVRAGVLIQMGLETVAKIAESTIEELRTIKGVGEATAKKILESARLQNGSNSKGTKSPNEEV